MKTMKDESLECGRDEYSAAHRNDKLKRAVTLLFAVMADPTTSRTFTERISNMPQKPRSYRPSTLARP